MHRPTQSRNQYDNKSSGPRPPALGEESFSKMTEETETSSRNSPPSYLNWAKSLHFLLEDDEGVDLLKKYVKEEDPSYDEHINFYFAIDGVRRQTEEFSVNEIIKALYKYLRRAKSLKMPEAVRRKIKDSLKSDSVEIGIDIFDPMHNEVDAVIRDEIYPAFLISSTYITYIQQRLANQEALAYCTAKTSLDGGNSRSSSAGAHAKLLDESILMPSGDKSAPPLIVGANRISTTHLCGAGGNVYGASTSASSSGSTSATETLPRSSTLPTLHEDAELSFADNYGKLNISDRPVRLTHELLLATQKRRLDIRPAGVPEYQPRSHIHISYVPNSRVESDRGSVSSGHRTDSDALSISNSCLDGRQHVQRRQFSQESKAIRQRAPVNKEVNDEVVIPRTERMLRPLKQEELLAELIPKLEKVKKERDKEEKFAAEHDLLNDQDILDQHVSRIWKDQTPELRTGATSPLPATAIAMDGPHMKHSKSLPENSSSTGKLISKWPSINTDSGISLYSCDSLRKYKESRNGEFKRKLQGDSQFTQQNMELRAEAGPGPGPPPLNSNGSCNPNLQKQVPPLPLPEKPQECTTVVFYFCDEEFPYRIKIPGLQPRLRQFRNYLPKKGSYRFFFKTLCEDPDSPVIQEELVNDSDILPLFEGKVAGIVKPYE